MKSYIKVTDTKRNEEELLYNLDSLIGTIAFTFTVIGICHTAKTIANLFKKEND